VRTQRVTFKADGVTLVGDLRLPDDIGPGGAPGLVFTGAFTAVKEQAAGTYAERLCRAGFATLCFDHRNWGASDGEPRQHEDPQAKITDLRAATSFLTNVDGVDRERLGAVGVCLGAGYAVRFTAFDPRIRALALITGGYNNPQSMAAAMNDGYRQALELATAAAERQDQGGPVEYLPAVAAGDYVPGFFTDNAQTAAMPPGEPYEYYGTARGGVPGWVNQVTRQSLWALLTTDLMSPADLIDRPAVIIHGEVDAYLPPEDAQAVYDRLRGPKDIFWLPATKHIDLYDVDEYIDPAVEHTATFLSKHLS
jgi:uncharacterized protein